MTPRQVFIGIAISLALSILSFFAIFCGVCEWVPYAFMFWYIFLIDWRKINE